MSGAAPPRPTVPVGIAALALTMLLGLQPITTDLYLPTLPVLAAHFGALPSALQLTMSVMVLSFGIGQLVWGPVADRFGRRPVLLLGLSVYLAASIGAALAGTIEWLVAMRGLQGATLAASVVCGRAMVRDLYDPRQGAQVMARGLTGLGLTALLSPPLGGLVTALWGWHAAFAAIAVLGGTTLLFIALRLPETQPQHNPEALRPGPLLRTWATMPRNRTFAGYAGLSACTYAGLMLFLVGSSFLMKRLLGLTPLQYGLALMSVSVAYILGTVLCRRALPRFGMAAVARCGAALALLGGAAMAALALAGVQGLWALLLPQLVYSVGHGLSQPCCQAGAVSAFPRQAGTAAALAGSILALLTFGTTWWLGHVLADSPVPVALGSGLSGALATLIAYTVLPPDRTAFAARARARA